MILEFEKEKKSLQCKSLNNNLTVAQLEFSIVLLFG